MNTLNLPSEDESSVATETPDLDQAATKVTAPKTGPCCEKCDAPMKSDLVTVCRRCGWYASLGRFLEVDQDWESYGDDAHQSEPAPRPSHAAVWFNMVPKWAWIVIATAAAVLVQSVAVRLLTSDGSMIRTVWSVTQLLAGFIAFAVCHVLTFLFASADDADTGALDIILRPVKLWLKAFANMPERLWVTVVATAGLTAVVTSILVIGGLPYERLWDWGFKKPTKANLMGAVMSQVQKVEGQGADNLEDAVKDFAGSQQLEPEKKKPVPPKPRHKADCVILGYRVDAEGRLQSLVLGAALKGKLVYACSVMPKLTDEESAGLLQMLADTRSQQPYLPVQVGALWVVPKYSCRVSFEKQEKSGQFVDPRWEEFLGAMR